MGLSALVAVVVAGACCMATDAATKKYVDKNAAGSGSGDGWTDAYPDLWPALEVLGAGDYEIWVAQGTYYPQFPENSAEDPTFYVRPGVKLYGGFVGGTNGETLLKQRDPVENPTILDGFIYVPEYTGTSCGDPEAGGCFEVHSTTGCDDADCCALVCAFNPDCCSTSWDENCVIVAVRFCTSKPQTNADSVVTTWDSNPLVVDRRRVDGFIIQHGGNPPAGDDLPADTVGGGVKVDAAGLGALVQLDVVRSVVIDNFASSGGGIAMQTNNPAGATFDDSAFVRVYNSEILGNKAWNYGGGFYAYGLSTYEIVNSVIARNGFVVDFEEEPQLGQDQDAAGLFERIGVESEDPPPSPERFIINSTIARNDGSHNPAIAQFIDSPDKDKLFIANSIVRNNRRWDAATSQYVECLTSGCRALPRGSRRDAGLRDHDGIHRMGDQPAVQRDVLLAGAHWRVATALNDQWKMSFRAGPGLGRAPFLLVDAFATPTISEPGRTPPACSR